MEVSVFADRSQFERYGSDFVVVLKVAGKAWLTEQGVML